MTLEINIDAQNKFVIFNELGNKEKNIYHVRQEVQLGLKFRAFQRDHSSQHQLLAVWGNRLFS